MADIDNDIFNSYYEKYHPNDKSLVCHDDKVFYNGESRQIYGFVGVYKGEQVKLVNADGHRYPVRTINPAVWKLDSALLFFIIKEAVKFYKKDISEINGKISFYLSRFNKNNLTETEKTIVLAEIDEYLVLKQQENVISDEVYDYVKAFEKQVNDKIFQSDFNSMSEGYKITYYKIYEAMQKSRENQTPDSNQNNSSSNQNEIGFARSRIGVAGKSKKTNPENLIYNSENTGTFGEAAFTNIKIILGVISIISLIIITIALILYFI